MQPVTSSPITTGPSIIPSVTPTDRAALTGRISQTPSAADLLLQPAREIPCWPSQEIEWSAGPLGPDPPPCRTPAPLRRIHSRHTEPHQGPPSFAMSLETAPLRSGRTLLNHPKIRHTSCAATEKSPSQKCLIPNSPSPRPDGTHVLLSSSLHAYRQLHQEIGRA